MYYTVFTKDETGTLKIYENIWSPDTRYAILHIRDTHNLTNHEIWARPVFNPTLILQTTQLV